MGEKIKISEGGGGEAMHRLLAEVVFKNLRLVETEGGTGLRAADDGAVILLGERTIVFTTDSYVVQPVFFRGGDIGKLAATGTLNDLGVMGARPLALSLALIVSEGFDRDDLSLIVRSAGETCEAVGVPIVTGDTKVVAGLPGGIMVNTSGLGVADRVISDSGLKPGDAVLLNGGVGEHGVAVLSQREGIAFETEIVSDCREVGTLVQALLTAGIDVRAAKDPTRGGIASALNEMASKAGVSLLVEEAAIPVSPAVQSACDLLGLDPFEIANEGKVLLGVPGGEAKAALEIMKRFDPRSAVIGRVTEEGRGEVVLETVIGSRRIMRMPLGDPIPRVC
jgi:hydrogenase expression/formation protein HypE